MSATRDTSTSPIDPSPGQPQASPPAPATASADRVRQSRALVKRERAQHYLLLTVISFAASVVVTRLFLMLTGYPKIGSGDLHIAHVLWGGLLLFIAALLPLIFANSWVLSLSAILNGVGVGLFIDEVGKFITTNNDYFYPLAAPIIYAFFLLTVMVYFQVRRPPAKSARAELYRIFELFGEMLDHDLEPRERAEIDAKLQIVIQYADQPDQARLARSLQDLLAAEDIYLAPDEPTLWERIRDQARAFEARWVGQRRLRVFIVAGLAIFGLIALAEPILVLTSVLGQGNLDAITRQLIEQGQVRGLTSLRWYFVGLTLQGVVGVLLLAASELLLAGRERSGARLGYFALLASLTTVNLLTLYYDQFGNLLLTVVQFLLLISVLHYRQRYVVPPPATT